MLSGFVYGVLAVSLGVAGLQISEPVDVHEGFGSSGFSYYGTSPESPDGRRLTYVVYPPDGPEELWICHCDLSDHRKLADVDVGFHNGAKAFWIDNHRLAYVSEGLRVIDVDTRRELFGPFEIRSETHLSVDHKIVFHGEVDGLWAVWELDCDSGELREITTLDELKVWETRAGAAASNEVTHIQPSQDGRRMLFRFGGGVGGRMGCIRLADGGGLTVFPGEKPMHFLWYDNDTVMGANWGFAAADHGPGDLEAFPMASRGHWYQRFAVHGGVLETLAGPITHGAASPDRQWYAGETANYGASPIRLALYERGSTEPAAILMDHTVAKMTWKKRAHVNPSFSRDGRRVYFFRAVSNERFKASFVDISSVLDEE